VREQIDGKVLGRRRGFGGIERLRKRREGRRRTLRKS